MFTSAGPLVTLSLDFERPRGATSLAGVGIDVRADAPTGGRALSVSRLRAALAGLLLYLVLTAPLVERMYLSLFQCGVLALTGVWIIRCSRQPRPAMFHPLMWALLALPLIGVLQVLTRQSVYAWRTGVATLDWTVWVAVAWLSSQAFGPPDSQVYFRKWMAITGLFVSALSLLHWYTSENRILWHWPNPYASQSPFPLLNHGHFAAFVELALGAAVWEGLHHGRGAMLYAWSAALMFAAVFAFGSRSGAAIVTLELLGLLLLAWRRSSRTPRRRLAGIAMLALILVAAIGWQGIAARFAAPPRDELRRLFASSTIDMINARPLIGFGLGNWDVVYPAYARIDPGMFVEHAHNDWLEWAAEGGLPFALLMLLLAIFALRRGLIEPWSLGIAAVFVHSTIDFPLHKPAIVAIQFAAIGCLLHSVKPRY